MDPVLDFGEGVRPGWGDHGPRGREAFVQIHHDLQAKRRLLGSVVARSPAAELSGTSSMYRSASFRKARAASDRSSLITIGVPSFTEIGMSRSLGIKTSGTRPNTASTSSCVIPTRVSARFRTSEI